MFAAWRERRSAPARTRRPRSSPLPSSCSPTVVSTASRFARSTGKPGSATRRHCSITSATAPACCGRSSPSMGARSTSGATRCSTSTTPAAPRTCACWPRPSCCRWSASSTTATAGAATCASPPSWSTAPLGRSNRVSRRSCRTRWAVIPPTALLDGADWSGRCCRRSWSGRPCTAGSRRCASPTSSSAAERASDHTSQTGCSPATSSTWSPRSSSPQSPRRPPPCSSERAARNRARRARV